MSRVLRYAVAGGVMDFTIYVALSLAPLLSSRWGAGPFVLGLLPVAWGVAYSLTAVFGGRISDRVSRTAMLRVGLLLIAAVCVFFSFATRTWHFFLGYPFIAVGMVLFFRRKGWLGGR